MDVEKNKVIVSSKFFILNISSVNIKFTNIVLYIKNTTKYINFQLIKVSINPI